MKFEGQNSLDIQKIYEERKKYKEHAFPITNVERPIDFLYENTKYGLKNSENETVYLLVDQSTRSSLKTFPDSSEEGAVFFVEMFEKFRKDYLSRTSASALGPIPGIENLIVKKGLVDFGKRYKNYLNSLKDFILRDFLVDYKIYNFGDYISAMRRYMKSHLSTFPLTRTGFIDSSNCPVHITGLVADLSTQDASRDAEKVAFMNNPSFSCYCSTAHEYGLIVDKNAPWRLVADLSSDQMKESISKYGPPHLTARNILDFKFFAKPHFDDIHDLQDLFFSIYQELTLEIPFEIDYNKNKRKFVEREPARQWFDEELYSFSFWIELLFSIRLIESGVKLSKEEKMKFLKEINDTFTVYGQTASMGHLGKIIASSSQPVRSLNSFRPIKMKDYL